MLFFASAPNCLTSRIEQQIRSFVNSDHPLEKCSGFAALRRHLQRPGNRFSLAVLMARNRCELDRLFSIRDLLSDLRLVVVVPAGKATMRAAAHNLRPRLVTDFQFAPHVITGVLPRMLERPATRAKKQ